MKALIKTLLREYFEDYDDDNFIDVIDFTDLKKKNRVSGFEGSLNKLPNIITLYRIVVANNINSIDKVYPGFHYSLDKNNLLSNHNQLQGKKYFLITIKVNKNLIDFITTIKNNMKYPDEKEITLKNKGFGGEIINIEPIN